MTALPRVAAAAALAVVYVGLAYTGWTVGSLPGSVSPVWPATGLAVVMALRLRGAGVAAVGLGELVANLTHGLSAWPSVGMAVGNMLEASCAAWMLQRLLPQGRLRHAGAVLRLFLAGAALPTLVAATVGVASLWAAGIVATDDLGRNWLVWWTGDALGVMFVAPCLLAFIDRDLREHLPRTGGHRLEVVAAIATLLTVGGWVFLQGTLAYLLLPALGWVALRLGVRASTAALLSVALVAVPATAHGYGPLADTGNVDLRLWQLDGFLLVLSLTTLVLAATVFERDSTARHLAALNESLERQVADRTVALRQESARLAEAQSLAHIGSWEWDIATNEVRWSAQLYDVFDVDPTTFGASYEHYIELLHPDDRQAMHVTIQRALVSHQPYELDHRILQRDGTVRWVRSRGQVHISKEGVLERLSGTAQDITKTVELHDELSYQAGHDPVTGLPNRRRFLQTWPSPHPQGVPQPRRASDHRSAQGALLFLDLDGFKPVNDAHGHHIGDQLLQHIADILTRTLRSDASIARLGGDEFAMLLPTFDPSPAGPSPSPQVAAQAVAARILDAIRQPVSLDGIPVRVTASIGITLVNTHDSVDDAVRRADSAMYRAKRNGGDQHVYQSNPRLRSVSPVDSASG